MTGWFYPSESAPVPTRQDAAWMPQSVWVLWRRENYVPAWDRTTSPGRLATYIHNIIEYVGTMPGTFNP